MTADSAGTRYGRASGFVARRVAGEILLVQTGARSVQPIQKAADLLILNATGERLWEAMATPTTLEQMAQYLIQDFDVEPATARADAEAFVLSMVDLGAVIPHE
ncbi:MAG TPA: PqqD family protein [Gemmatimonadaceae bacterium]|nr:PqqD family protein [Gemmatimonadaceae bacterium]